METNPLKSMHILEFTPDGNLILRDADGSFVWSTSKSDKSVSGLSLTNRGNLVLFDRQYNLVGSHLTTQETVALGQKVVNGLRLTAGSLDSNSNVMYSLALKNRNLVAYIEPYAPQVYFYSDMNEIYGMIGSTKGHSLSVQFENWKLCRFHISFCSSRSSPDVRFGWTFAGLCRDRIPMARGADLVSGGLDDSG